MILSIAISSVCPMLSAHLVGLYAAADDDDLSNL